MTDAEINSQTKALLVAQRTRDVETGGHTQRVTRLALRLGREFALTELERTALKYGALLHDLGKIGTPDAILKKTGRHTDEERAVMRQHVSGGVQMLRALKFPREIWQLVAQHHERWDGAGYPAGLRGAEIDLTARIFAVADTLDAMTSNRCYRRSLGYSRARQEISECSGTQFDPQVVAAFLAIDPADWDQLRGVGSRERQQGPKAVSSRASFSPCSRA